MEREAKKKGEIVMTLWEDYALQLDDAIEKNHFVREPLVLMLTLAKIKDAKCEYNVFFYQYGFEFSKRYFLFLDNPPKEIPQCLKVN